MANTFNALTSGSGGIATTGDSSGAFSFTKDGGSSEVYIDASGNVGIGTATPANLGKLAVVNGNIVANGGGTADPEFRLSGASSGVTRNYAIGTDAAQTLYVYDYTAGAYRTRIDSSGNFQFNSGYGSVATAYGCRAWVNFNGTGTVAIRASGNVSSITDVGTGNYKINFTTNMPDANYAMVGSGDANGSYTGVVTTFSTGTVSTSQCQIQVSLPGTNVGDPAYCTVAFFR